MRRGQQRIKYNSCMLDTAIKQLQAKHPWMLYAEAFALLMDSYERHSPENKYSGMTKTLMKIDFGIFLREDRNKLLNRLSLIQEYV